MINVIPQDAPLHDEQAAFEAFKRFVFYFQDLFRQPGFLDPVPCRQSYKDYVPHYYADLFGPDAQGITPRHLKWFRRLRPLMALPRTSRILDYGGGYGMDFVFLASLGFDATFYEITPHHVAIARSFADRFGERFGKLTTTFVLSGKDPDPAGLDAILLDEVAHHIEPVGRLFSAAARMLRPGGSLFLLEPNYLCPATQAYFFKVRGFNTLITLTNEETGEKYIAGNENIRPVPVWAGHARKAGFALRDLDYVVPWFMRGEKFQPSLLRRVLENAPFSSHLLASHQTMRFEKAVA